MLHTHPGEPEWNKNTVKPEKSGKYHIVYKDSSQRLLSNDAEYVADKSHFIIDSRGNVIPLSSIILWR